MSVTTEADEHLEGARKHVREAIKHLNEILVLQCWGHDEYRQDFREKLRASYASLIQIRDALE